MTGFALTETAIVLLRDNVLFTIGKLDGSVLDIPLPDVPTIRGIAYRHSCHVAYMFNAIVSTK